MKRSLYLLITICLISTLFGCSLKKPGSGIIPDVIAMPEQTAGPAPSPEPADEPAQAPAEEVIVDTAVRYKSRVSSLNCRSKPDMNDDKTIVTQIGYEEEVTFLTAAGDFCLVRLDDGQEVYCYADYLVSAEEELYAYLKPETGQKVNIRTGELEYESDGVTPVMVKNELIDLRLYLPDARYELLFATERNVIGEPLYPRAIPLMQKDTAEKLQKAFDIFKADGYTLKIYDAYRPLSVQRRLFAVVKNSKWIANPNTTASNHNRGAATDIALINDATGEEIDFPTPMHTFSYDSARTSKTWTDEQRANVDYMTSVMEKCGFRGIESEWWHFNDTNSAKYMTTDLDLSKINMEPKRD